MENTCTITVTRSRIDTGLIAIPKELSSLFPNADTEIRVWLDDEQPPLTKKFAPHTSSTKECRIYGMSGWYKVNRVRPGDRLLIERLSEREKLYLLSLRRQGESTELRADEELPFLSCDTSEPPPRVRAVVQRVVRDTAKAKRLKRLYGYQCQLCGVRLPVAGESYVIEVHHLRPLGAEHSGIDDFGNMIVLCPNHHALFDYRVPRFLAPDAIELYGERITITSKHTIDGAAIEYHNTVIARRAATSCSLTQPNECAVGDDGLAILSPLE